MTEKNERVVDVLISSRNPDKIKEIRNILALLPIRLLTPDDVADLPLVEEDADTLVDNAIKKAKTLAEHSGLPTIADDTGLFVSALEGRPGVWSARYAGENCTYRDNRLKLLHEMADKTDRKAFFGTVAVLVIPGKENYFVAEGILEGEITREEIGDKGFGYDAVFKVTELDTTLAEMTIEQKNELSHRSRAFKALAEKIKELPWEDLK
jgi:XTP/dITP diphosphohydrolase